MTDLKGKTALVTGASRGIGRATRAGARRGRGAGAGALRPAPRRRPRPLSPKSARPAGAPMRSAPISRAPDGPHQLAHAVRGIVGDRLDILVANAGVAKSAMIEDTTVADFDGLFAVNVRAPFFLVQQLLPILQEGSSVMLLSSLAAHAAVGTLSAYAATKGAIDTLVKHFAVGARCRAASASTRWRPAWSIPTCRASPRRRRAATTRSACRR